MDELNDFDAAVKAACSSLTTLVGTVGKRSRSDTARPAAVDRQHLSESGRGDDSQYRPALLSLRRHLHAAGMQFAVFVLAYDALTAQGFQDTYEALMRRGATIVVPHAVLQELDRRNAQHFTLPPHAAAASSATAAARGQFTTTSDAARAGVDPTSHKGTEHRVCTNLVSTGRGNLCVANSMIHVARSWLLKTVSAREGSASEGDGVGTNGRLWLQIPGVEAIHPQEGGCWCGVECVTLDSCVAGGPVACALHFAECTPRASEAVLVTREPSIEAACSRAGIITLTPMDLVALF
jgi:hypothetical protein